MYYVYILLDPRKENTPFYVGKGTGDRWKDHLKETDISTTNPRKYNVIRKIIEAGLEVECKIVSVFDNESDAYALEESLIQKYGRRGYDKNGILTNLCESRQPPRWQDGPNRNAIIQKMRDTRSAMDLSHTDETKKKISESQKGKKKPPRSEEHRKKLSEALKGKPLTRECSEQTRMKRSANQKGKKASTETKEAISKALTGRVLSEEHKQKIREARLANIEKKKRELCGIDDPT